MARSSPWNVARSAVARTAVADTFVKALVFGARSGARLGATDGRAESSKHWRVLRGRVHATIVSNVFVHTLLDVVDGRHEAQA